MSELLRGRRFRVWDYCISHSQLLIRSCRDGDHDTNVDMVFSAVTFFDGPLDLGEIALQDIADEEHARLEPFIRDGGAWAIQGCNGRLLIAACGLSIEQNRDGMLSSPFRPGATIEAPDILEVEIAPADPCERPALIEALAALAADAPYRHAVDKASGRILLRGGSEFDLAPWLTTRAQRIAVHAGPPRVLYRQTLAQPVTLDETYKTRVGDTAAFARVVLAFEPKLCGTGASFASRIKGGAVPDAYLGGVADGVWEALAEGPHGMPVVDVAVVLMNGAYHDADSSPAAFAAAAGAATRRALREAGTALLEPMMRVEVSMPARYVQAVRDDLVARRGRILDSGWSGTTVDMVGRVPLANMLGYQDQLRGLTQGQGRHAMRFDSWEPVDPPEPPSLFRPAMALRAVQSS